MLSPTYYKDTTSGSSFSPSERSSDPFLGDISITQQKPSEESWTTLVTLGMCPNSGLISGGCVHGSVRWIRVPCKRRDCPVCGVHRKRKIAWRIAYGIETLGSDLGAAWITGTWANDVPKREATKTVAKFLRWLREGHGQYKEVKRRRIASFERRNGRKPTREEKRDIGRRVRQSLHRDMEYASTWEQQRRGVLHVNLILTPWKYIPKAQLQKAWQRFGGGNIWVKRVGCEVGVEAAKVNGQPMTIAESRQQIANYVAKWDQMVQSGRGVCYSRGWPGLPVEPTGIRRGDIYWSWIHGISIEARMFWYGQQAGEWREVAPGEYGRTHGEKCHCFDRVAQREVIQRDPPDRLTDEDLHGCQEWFESINHVVHNIVECRREEHAKHHLYCGYQMHLRLN